MTTEHATIRYRDRNIPDELKHLDRWIVFALEGVARRVAKVPYVPGLRIKARSNDPTTWRPFEIARAAAEHSNLYLGFAFTPELGMTFIDLDTVLGAHGAVKQYAQLIIDTLDSYTECSLNNGIHIFVRGRPPEHFTTEQINGKVEVYPQSGGRFCLVTGFTRPGLGSLDGFVEERSPELARLFPARAVNPRTTPQDQNGSHAKLTDDELDAVVGVLRRSWVDGKKHDLGLAIAGILAKNGIPKDQALAIIDRLSSVDDRPQEREKVVQDSYKRAKDGLDVRGYQALRELVPPEALSIVDGILQRVWSANQAKIVRFTTKREAELDDDALPIVEDPHLTDLGNAQRLVARHGHDLRYCSAKGAWLAWDGRRWQWDESGEVERRAKDTVKNLYREAADLPSDKERKKLIAHGLRSEASSRIRAMIDLARSEPGIPVAMADLDADPLLFNMRNGTVDLRIGTLRAPCRADLITRLVDIDHDPLAACPRFTAFLDEVLPDSDIRAWVQQFFGYALAGGTGEHVVPIAHGEGQNGKSTIVDVIEAVLGPYCVRADMESFLVNRQSGGGSGATPDLARLKGARVVLASESAQGRKLNVARIKDLAGGESIVARELYGKPFTFVPQFSIWLSTNDKPDVPGNDFALWRRLRLIPFLVKIPEERRILGYDQILVAEEGPGIIAWILDGLATWQRAGRLPVVEAIAAATKEYQIESDPVERWIDECCTVGQGLSDGAGALYESFRKWFENEDSESKPMNNTAFGRDLTKKQFARFEGSGGRKLRNGLALRPKEDNK